MIMYSILSILGSCGVFFLSYKFHKRLNTKYKRINSIVINQEVRDIFLSVKDDFKDSKEIPSRIFPSINTKNYIIKDGKIEIDNDGPDRIFYYDYCILCNIFFCILELSKIDEKNDQEYFDILIKHIYLYFITPSALGNNKRIYEVFKEVQDQNPEYFFKELRPLIGDKIFKVIEKIDFLKEYEKDKVEENNKEVLQSLKELHDYTKKNIDFLQEEFKKLKSDDMFKKNEANFILDYVLFICCEKCNKIDFDVKFLRLKNKMLKKDIMNLRSLLKTEFAPLEVQYNGNTEIQSEIKGRDCSKIFELFFDLTFCDVKLAENVFEDYMRKNYFYLESPKKVNEKSGPFKQLYEFFDIEKYENLKALQQFFKYVENFIKVTDKYYY